MATEREQFDADIERVKRGLYKNPGEAAIYSRERGLGPGIAKRRLEDRGVDVRGLVANEPTDSDYKKGGKVSSASKRADGIATKGKTRGTIVAMCGGGMYKK